MKKNSCGLKVGGIVFILAFLALSLLGCDTRYLYDASLYADSDQWDENQSVLNGLPFSEDKSIYQHDEDGSIRYLYLTIQEGIDKDLDKKYSFSDLNNYTDSELAAGEEPFCNVILREGTDTSSYGLSLFGFGETDANAKITIKGNTEKIKVRSYQIQLYDRGGRWNNLNTINLLKSRDDLSRMKQKLGFDALEELQDIGSLRTGFVRLFVQDTTSDQTLAYEDLGIFTYIEQPNTSYLEAHELDANGTLYRAENFDFSRNESRLLSKDAADYNAEQFESVLNIRKAASHEKFLAMLTQVNDYSVPINDVIAAYFNEANLLTYAAVNILFSNFEAVNKDYLLYSPQNSLTWYLLPGSFEEAFMYQVGKDEQKIPDALIGVGFLDNNVLFRRYFSEPANLEKLILKMDAIREKINAEFIGKQTLIYRKSILKYIYSMPEITLLPRAAEYVEPYIASLPLIFQTNYEKFIQNLEKPVAPYLISFEQTGQSGTFTFVKESPLSERRVSYFAEFSTSADFSVIIATSAVTNQNQITVEMLPEVSCFARIVANDENGNQQFSTNISTDRKGDTYYGCIFVERRVN